MLNYARYVTPIKDHMQAWNIFASYFLKWQGCCYFHKLLSTMGPPVFGHVIRKAQRFKGEGSQRASIGYDFLEHIHCIFGDCACIVSRAEYFYMMAVYTQYSCLYSDVHKKQLCIQ